MQVLGLRRLKLPTIGPLVQFGERSTCLTCRHHLVGIDGHANGIGDELRRRTHPLAGLLPAAKIVGLQFDTIAVGVFIVKGGGKTMIETGVWLDTQFL